jgi:rSAM/selenodomain-associated transferase 2
MTTAFESLKTNPVVFGPANDGGYYLVGLTRPAPELFQGVAWGTDTVLAQSREILARNDRTPALLAPLDDLDRPEDVAAWKRLVEIEDTDLSRVSVIIPALNEAEQITTTIASARAGKPHEILVVDGGSTDSTILRARRAGATVINTAAGRARQMNAGAARATGSVLLFLHADTLLAPDYVGAVSTALHEPKVAAGAFRFRIAENFAGKWIVERMTHLRSRWGSMPYGDQALFLRKSLFEEIGGYANLPIMEDYELVRRLRHWGRVVTLAHAATTSGRRWRRLGFLRTTAVNRLTILGYLCGVAPERLGAFYRGQGAHAIGQPPEPRHARSVSNRKRAERGAPNISHTP